MTNPGQAAPGRRRPVWLIVIIVAVVAVLLASGLYIAFGSKGGDGGDSASSEGSGSSAPESVGDQFSSPGTDGLGRKVMNPINGVGVPLPQDTAGQKGFDDPAARTSVPAGLMWQRTAGVVTPFSTSDGPTGMDGTTPTGFARTPAGALLASVTYTWRLMDGRLAAETVEKGFDPSTQNYDEALKQTRAMGPADTIGDDMPRPSAFSLSGQCDADYCAPTVSFEALDGSVRTLPTQIVVWKDGDWKGIYTPGDESDLVDGQAPGMIPW